MRKEPWDWPEEPRKRSRRPRIERVEILPPRQPEQRIHVNVNVRRRPNIMPRAVTIAAMIVLALILVRSPGALIMLAVIIPAWFWLAVGVIIAVLTIVAIRERLAGRNF
jgi:hypothetical protein